MDKDSRSRSRREHRLKCTTITPEEFRRAAERLTVQEQSNFEQSKDDIIIMPCPELLGKDEISLLDKKRKQSKRKKRPTRSPKALELCDGELVEQKEHELKSPREVRSFSQCVLSKNGLLLERRLTKLKGEIIPLSITLGLTNRVTLLAVLPVVYGHENYAEPLLLLSAEGFLRTKLNPVLEPYFVCSSQFLDFGPPRQLILNLLEKTESRRGKKLLNGLLVKPIEQSNLPFRPITRQLNETEGIVCEIPLLELDDSTLADILTIYFHLKLEAIAPVSILEFIIHGKGSNPLCSLTFESISLFLSLHILKMSEKKEIKIFINKLVSLADIFYKRGNLHLLGPIHFVLTRPKLSSLTKKISEDIQRIEESISFERNYKVARDLMTQGLTTFPHLQMFSRDIDSLQRFKKGRHGSVDSEHVENISKVFRALYLHNSDFSTLILGKEPLDLQLSPNSFALYGNYRELLACNDKEFQALRSYELGWSAYVDDLASKLRAK